MGGRVLIVERGVFPAQLAGRVDRNIIHIRHFGNVVPLRHRGRVFVQRGLFVKGEVVVRGHAARQPALMLVIRVFAKGDVVKHLARLLALGRLHIAAHDLAVQRGQHMAENIWSVHFVPPALRGAGGGTGAAVSCPSVACSSRSGSRFSLADPMVHLGVNSKSRG